MKAVVIGLIINSLISPLYYGGLEDKDTSPFARWVDYWYYTLNGVILVVFGLFRTAALKAYYRLKNFLLLLILSNY